MIRMGFRETGEQDLAMVGDDGEAMLEVLLEVLQVICWL